jgi:hypothetical protein
VRIVVTGEHGPANLVLGMLYGLRYHMSGGGGEVSYSMFAAAWKRLAYAIVKPEFSLRAIENSIRTIHEFVRNDARQIALYYPASQWIAHYEDRVIQGCFQIPYRDEKSEQVGFKFWHQEGRQYELEMEVLSPDREAIECAILMQWACLDYDLMKAPLTERMGAVTNTLPLGLWIAAKIYHSFGDVAGALATIDEGIDV